MEQQALEENLSGKRTEETKRAIATKAVQETYYWSLRKAGLSLEGLGEEFEIMRIAFELEDLKKDKEKRREKIGDFFLSERI